jgi:cell division protein FtsB
MRPSRKPRVILIILIALCGIFVYNYTARLGEKAHIESEIAAMQARIDAAKSEQYELLKERDELNQPDYLDNVARKTFGLARPGDKLLVIVDDPAASSHADEIAVSAAANPIDYRNFPIWQQWIVFFTTDSFALSLQ